MCIRDRWPHWHTDCDLQWNVCGTGGSDDQCLGSWYYAAITKRISWPTVLSDNKLSPSTKYTVYSINRFSTKHKQRQLLQLQLLSNQLLSQGVIPGQTVSQEVSKWAFDSCRSGHCRQWLPTEPTVWKHSYLFYSCSILVFVCFYLMGMMYWVVGHDLKMCS